MNLVVNFQNNGDKYIEVTNSETSCGYAFEFYKLHKPYVGMMYVIIDGKHEYSTRIRVKSLDELESLLEKAKDELSSGYHTSKLLKEVIGVVKAK